MTAHPTAAAEQADKLYLPFASLPPAHLSPLLPPPGSATHAEKAAGQKPPENNYRNRDPGRPTAPLG